MKKTKKAAGASGSGNTDGKETPPGGDSGDGKTGDDDEEGESADDEGGEGGDGKDESGSGEGGTGDDDLSKLPKATQDYIKKLRGENAKYRTRANKFKQDHDALSDRLKKLAGGEEELTPEQHKQALEASNAQLQFDNATLNAAIKNGVTGEDQIEYFRFLVAKSVDALEDGGELDDEEIAALAKKAKGAGGAGAGGKAKTSVTGGGEGTGGAGAAPKPGESGEVTLEQFVKMTIGQKTELHSKNNALYRKLFDEARSKKLL